MTIIIITTKLVFYGKLFLMEFKSACYNRVYK